MSTVPQWTGREVRALREARRMSVREFASHLGVSDRMVSKWEAGGETMRPRSMNQAALDTSLAMASPDTRTRFDRLAGAQVAQIEPAVLAVGVQHLVRHPVDGKLMTLIEAGAHTSAQGSIAWMPGFYIDVHPTTSLDYAGFVTATGHRVPPQWPSGGYVDTLAESPVNVPWVDALAYAAWASKSLPSPAQWDRAADSESGMVLGNLAEWCSTSRGPRRHDRRHDKRHEGRDDEGRDEEGRHDEGRDHERGHEGPDRGGRDRDGRSAGRHAGGGSGQPTFRCVVSVVEMLGLLAI